jgi:type I restriction enzyme, R subunit
MGVSSNFDFLTNQDERLARLGALAERYFFDDAPSALIKLRQLGEFIAKDVAARTPCYLRVPLHSTTYSAQLNKWG